MVCPDSLAALQQMRTSLIHLEEEMTKYDNIDLPGNIFQKIPDGWKEDIKRFSVASVDNTDTEAQLTGMETGFYYIIKEIRYFASGTIAADASHAIKDTLSKTVFANGYYNEGSFSILAGNRNGIIGKPLTEKPTVVLNSGTGMAAQTWYGSIKYYFR